MSIIPTRRIQAALLAILAATLFCWGSAAYAEPFHTVTVDGTITGDGADWAPADRIVVDYDDDDSSRNGNVRHLWLTWDEQNLYLGVNYQALDRTLVLYLDTGTGVGPEDATVFAESPRSLLLPEGRHADLMISHYHSGFTDLGTLSAWRADDASGAVTDITAATVNAQTFGVDGDFPDKSVFWFRNEIAIPWSEVYPDGLPARAVLRAAAAVTAAADSSGADDAMPGLGRLEDADLPIRLAGMQASIVDQDGDGAPDPLDAGAAGTVTLPLDPGSGSITVTATLTDWSGAAITGPLSTVVTADGERAYRVGRLAAGTYTLSASAPGYFPAEQTVTVAAGQELTGADFTLQKATTITGTLTLELGQYLGGYRFRDPAGTVLDEGELLPSQFPFDFTYYVVDSGTYTLEAWASNHLATSFDLVVTAGEDLLDLDLVVARAPLLSGVVSFNTGPGADGTVTLGNAAGDTIFETVAVSAADPAFSFYAARLGDLRLVAVADTYLETGLTLTAEAGVDQTGLSLPLARMPRIDGSIAFLDGPGNAGHVSVTGLGESAVADTLDFGAAGGALDPVHLPEGDYEVAVDAPGYGLWAQTLTLEGGDTVTDLGEIDLAAVRADRLRLLDAEGLPVESLSATVSIEDEFYAYAMLTIEAVDENGRRDLFDLDDKLGGLDLTPRKLDDQAPPRGDPVFLASEDFEDVIPGTPPQVDIVEGVTTFYMVNYAIEVLRVFVGPEVPDPLKQGPEPPTARVMVGFNDPRPATVVLSAARDTLAADGTDALTIMAQLYDSAGNLSELPEIPVTFTVTNASSGQGAFTVPTVQTSPDGLAQAELTATGAGELLVDCAVVVDNETLEVRVDTVDGEPGPLAVTVVPGPTVAWRLSLATQLSGLDVPVAVTGQLVDGFDNPTPLAGETLDLTADPPALGTFADPAPVSDGDGRVLTTFIPSGSAGLVTLGGSSPLYPADEALLQLRDVTVVVDPPYDQEPDDHQTFAATDLTVVVLDNTPDALSMDIPFASNWEWLRFHILFETQWDAGGGGVNPFDFPVVHGHEHRPDYSLNIEFDGAFGTVTYSDLRKWDTSWENWWDTETGEYVNGYTDGVRLEGRWLSVDAEGLHLTIPWAPFGGAPDSLRYEVYITQKDGGSTLRSALDSVPPDATLNLNWDPDDPDGPWDSMTASHTLSAWSPTYVVRTDFPTPPTVANAAADPAELEAGMPLTLTARVTDAGDGVGDVLADLSAIAGSPLARMHDDGETTHGDETAGDGVYSLRTLVPLGSPGGEQALIVSAFEAGNLLAGRDTAAVDIAAQVDLIVSAVDPEDDDHGPNQAGEERKFYTYPTNSVFVPGAFDLLSLNIYETTAVVGGQAVEMIAFEVGLGDFPDPAEPHTADWNPPYGDLNITKIDIMIDSAPGGATRSLPNRRVDFQAWNAWDFAVVMDGWYKALVPSLGQNTVESWRENALRTDAEIQLLGDFDRDTVTALVAKSALGNPSPDDIRGWNMAVLVSSHDFGGEEVLGGIRWVNESRSEWNFGGGHFTDRDPNIMDLLLVPGVGRDPGDPQEVVLDYETPEAIERLENNETPCVMSITAFEDTGPPVIRITRDFGEVMLREPLAEAPLAFTLEIFDDFRVEDATFRYRSTTQAGDSWDVETSMGFIGDNLWSVDIPDAWMESELIYSPVDSTRYFEFEVEARDATPESDGGPKVTTSPIITVQVEPASESLYIQSSLGEGDITLRHVEGSSLIIDDALRAKLVDLFREAGGSSLEPDTLATLLDVGWAIGQVPPGARGAPAVPSATALGVFREIALDVGDAEQFLQLEDRLPGLAGLSLHYMDDDLAEGRDEQKIGIYEYKAASDRWLLVGGHVNELANTVTANIDHAGAFGLFWSAELAYDRGEVISGITVSPNPFSPNGDGLYDRASIGFYLSQEATVTVEVYNIEGRLKRRLQETFPYSGVDNDERVPRRVEGLVWDGTDENRNNVPYGIYILRLIVTYNQAGGQRTIRSNHPVAVIR